jgi:hypothetical protein
MIKKTALQSRLAEIGKIKTGGKGETRTKQGGGGTYQLPVKFGHFVVTTTERDKSGNFKPDTEVMKTLGAKPRELPIRLLFDSINMNLQTEFAMYHGKKKACSGDGEGASRLKKKNDKLTDEYETLPCEGTDCEHFKASPQRCKVSARLFCAIPRCMELGGVHVFRTHSINSVMAMTGALEFFRDNTNGILQGLPLKLKMVKKQTEEHGEIDFVTIVLDGLEMMEMRKAAALEKVHREELGVDIGRYEANVRESGLLIDHDKPEDIETEFYNDQNGSNTGKSDNDQKEPIHGKSDNDVAKAIASQNKTNTEPGNKQEPPKHESPI